ncbi:MAG: hypothetical protein ABUS57_16165 [Pseudomonadota bacterium]
MDISPFEDADEFPDELWDLIDPYNARSVAEHHFIRVMRFHGDFLNGGLNQVMYNVKAAWREDIGEYVAAFEVIGLAPFSTIIALADKEVFVGVGWESVFNLNAADLDKVYSAMAFGVPVAQKEHFKEYLSEREPGVLDYVDWVARAALKYARDNIGEFSNLRRLWHAPRA